MQNKSVSVPFVLAPSEISFHIAQAINIIDRISFPIGQYEWNLHNDVSSIVSKSFNISPVNQDTSQGEQVFSAKL